jgi:hypothetical protein
LIERLAAGNLSQMTGEHAFHVLEAILAAHESAATGRRVAVESRFPWPVIRFGVVFNFRPVPPQRMNSRWRSLEPAPGRPSSRL